MPIIIGILLAPVLYFPIWTVMASFERNPWLGILVVAAWMAAIVFSVKLIKNKFKSIERDYEAATGPNDAEKEKCFEQMFNVTSECENIAFKIKSRRQCEVDEVTTELSGIFVNIPHLAGHESDGREVVYDAMASRFTDKWLNAETAKMLILINHGYAPELHADTNRFKIPPWFISFSPDRPRGVPIREKVPTAEFANELCEWANKKFDEFERWAYIEYNKSDDTFLVHKKFGYEWYRMQKQQMRKEKKKQRR